MDMIAGQYNAKAIAALKSGKAEAWEYIKAIPIEYRAGCVSTIKLILKRS